MVNRVKDLHVKYGPVIRVGPDELSFIDPSAWKDIYINKPQLPKPTKGIFKSYNGVPNLVTWHITEEHASQRHILNPAFSKNAVKD